MVAGFEFNCRRVMHAEILRAVDKWENAFPLIANPFFFSFERQSTVLQWAFKLNSALTMDQKCGI
jgi:hypothetical protein